MHYKISLRQKKNAAKLGVNITVSSNPKKKIDVYKNGVKVAEIGAAGYFDYATYIKRFGLKFANQRKKLYKVRHNNDRNVKGSPGYYADQILWS